MYLVLPATRWLFRCWRDKVSFVVSRWVVVAVGIHIEIVPKLYMPTLTTLDCTSDVLLYIVLFCVRGNLRLPLSILSW